MTKIPDHVKRQLEYLLVLLDPIPEVLLQSEQKNNNKQNYRETQLKDIADWLYENWYTTGATPALALNNELSFEQDLSTWLKEKADSSKKWENDWVVTETNPTGYCIAGKDNALREVFPGDYFNATRPSLPPAPGDKITIASLMYGTDDNSGFWHTESSSGFPEEALSRFYINIGWRNAGMLVNRITTLLDDISVHYSLKCPCNPKYFNRVDSFVIYLNRSDINLVEPQLIKALDQYTDRLNSVGPPLTKEITPTLYFADDPNDKEESFGTSRCSALATGVYNLIYTTPKAKNGLEQLTTALIEKGINPVKPWLY